MNADLIESPVATRLKAPGTCGEFVQGYIDGTDFLVNCPIDLYSRATVHRNDAPGLHLRDAHRFSKIRDAVTLAAHEFMFGIQHHIAVTSEVPRGKGMASSTADVSAALAAVLRSCGLRASPHVFARIVTEVEPSDCTHFEGVAHVNHLTGDLLEALPPPRDMRVLVVDCGGEVDTLGFDREKARAVYRRCREHISGALELLKRGLREFQDAWVAEAATISARISQEILFKPQFDPLLAVVSEVGALGVNCAHSGSVLGILYRGRDELGEQLAARVRSEFGTSAEVVGDYRIIAGGCHEH